MQKIGFVDFYLSEWHANHYPAWIAETCKQTGQQYTVAYAWAEQDVSPVDGRSSDEWCAAMGIEKCGTLEELCEKSDCIAILAPSNPEKHLAYAEKVLAYGKRTYIDKTFAPDYATALKIFQAAEAGKAPFFSSSALRYADELTDLVGGTHVTTQGGGSNFPEYAVHQLEMIVKILAARAERVRVERQGAQYVCRIQFEGGKTATMLYAEPLPFTVCVQKADGQNVFRTCDSDYFRNLIADMLRFFDTGKPSFDIWQTKEIMKLREAVLCNKPDTWIEL